MELRDLIVTPLVILIVLIGAFIIRPRVTDEITRKYFLPALGLKIFGALALGFIYQFYYNGGDTYNYHTHGSRIIWSAFVDSPATGVKLLFSNGEYAGETFKYASQIAFYTDPSSFFLVRVATVLDLITFSSYSATAVFFAVIGFIGMWLLFLTFYRMFPHLHRWFAAACFFIPSVFFWGSGLLKDTLTLACIGMMVYSLKNIFIDKRFSIKSIVLLIVCVWVIFSVKKYILLCLLPAVLFWIYAEPVFRIRSVVTKVLIVPIMMVGIVLAGYWAVIKVGEGDKRYSIDKIAETAKITAYDIGFYSGRDAGSTYNLGELDGTFGGMLKLAPAAINVTLFRPYLWEVNNPLMLLSALESFLFICVVVFVIYRKGFSVMRSMIDANVLFCLVFSITFAFAVGVSTFNFGTLSRYKIPVLPFLVIGIAVMYNYTSNKERKVEVLESTE